MDHVNYSYAMKRSNMGKQPMYCMQSSQVLDTVAPDALEAKKYILRNPVNQLTQNMPSFALHEVNTVRIEHTESGANHAEGGWPKDVNVNDPEATQRYRRRIEKDDVYISCVMKNSSDVEHYINQNNAIDMYQIYYSELDVLPKQENIECRTMNEYHDMRSERGRPISSICWKPDGGQHFAVSYLRVDFDWNTLDCVDASIWDADNSTNPLTSIVPPCGMLDLQYNPKEPQVLVSALISGQVAAFDERTPLAAVALSPAHEAHRDAVRNVLFINSKSGQEFFSGGTDGALKWWDLRRLDAPTEQLCLDMVKAQEPQSMSRAKGVSVLEFEPTMPTRFMVGTEDGLVLTGNRKAKTVADKISGKFDAHWGPVWALKRNPGFLKNFLTVGDWSARVWSEDCKESAILWTPPGRQSITDGAWSPTRFSLMLLAQTSGVLTLWDLLKRHHEPLLSLQVCEEPLAKVVPHDAGALVACGSRRGNVYLLELSAALAGCGKQDKALLTQVLEREARRERILEARLREIKLRLRKAEEPSPAASLASADGAAADADLEAAAAEYAAVVRKELTGL
ncbi:hypothetical protein PYW07_000682 [Mythimna separata]|uniref:Dynein intermediate chain 3, ciliary n=1 Tax=Mythimna separata TaxID=271217 RepID=A0AAD7YSC1_MYTSE|nr:hypothetical protein PYW07_000682 [Mythimna separata]